MGSEGEQQRMAGGAGLGGSWGSALDVPVLSHSFELTGRRGLAAVPPGKQPFHWEPGCGQQDGEGLRERNQQSEQGNCWRPLP